MEEMEKKELMDKINAMVNTPKHYVRLSAHKHLNTNILKYNIV